MNAPKCSVPFPSLAKINEEHVCVLKSHFLSHLDLEASALGQVSVQADGDGKRQTFVVQ